MHHRTLIVVAALVGVLTPGLARAGEKLADLVAQVGTLRAAKDYASAATLAAEGAAREDLTDAARVVLGGLARQSFEMSYKTGGPITELCGVAAVMRLVAPLDHAKAGAVKLAVAVDTEAQLARALGPTWRAACAAHGETPTADTHGARATQEREASLRADASPRPTARGAMQPEVQPFAVRPDMSLVGSRTDRRRVRAGVGTLVPGVLLFVPMAAALAYRADADRDMAALRARTKGRESTEAEVDAALALDRRYMGTTIAAAVLGTTGAALVVTGTILLATGGRPRRVAVAPWGARSLGGLVLQGRF